MGLALGTDWDVQPEATIEGEGGGQILDDEADQIETWSHAHRLSRPVNHGLERIGQHEPHEHVPPRGRSQYDDAAPQSVGV